jgi:Protein of unknwon function (DUF3310)
MELHDAIDHPRHYTAYSGLEVIDLTEQMNFNRGNAVKYVCRAGFKGDENTEIEDLRKAIWYLKREVDRLFSIREV